MAVSRTEGQRGQAGPRGLKLVRMTAQAIGRCGCGGVVGLDAIGTTSVCGGCGSSFMMVGARLTRLENGSIEFSCDFREQTPDVTPASTTH